MMKNPITRPRAVSSMKYPDAFIPLRQKNGYFAANSCAEKRFIFVAAQYAATASAPGSDCSDNGRGSRGFSPKSASTPRGENVVERTSGRGVFAQEFSLDEVPHHFPHRPILLAIRKKSVKEDIVRAQAMEVDEFQNVAVASCQIRRRLFHGSPEFIRKVALPTEIMHGLHAVRLVRSTEFNDAEDFFGRVQQDSVRSFFMLVQTG